MKTTSTLRHFLGLCLLLAAATVYADIPLESDQQIVGTWRLEYSKKNLETDKVMERSDTWIIENGKFLMKNIRGEGTPAYDSVPTTYKIEDGLFKVALGRPGKFDNYSLISRDSDSMVLKDRMGFFYHFKKK